MQTRKQKLPRTTLQGTYRQVPVMYEYSKNWFKPFVPANRGKIAFKKKLEFHIPVYIWNYFRHHVLLSPVWFCPADPAVDYCRHYQSGATSVQLPRATLSAANPAILPIVACPRNAAVHVRHQRRFFPLPAKDSCWPEVGLNVAVWGWVGRL